MSVRRPRPYAWTVPTTSQLLAFALASILFIQVPGPSLLFTIGRALTVGRRAALLSVLGNALGLIAQIVAVALGLGAVVAASAAAYTVLKIVGAGWVVWLGIQAIRHRGDARVALLLGERHPGEDERGTAHRLRRRRHQPQDDRVLRGVPAAVHQRRRRSRRACRSPSSARCSR